jgi:secondary thiamine-phosphate synthase enzyme
MSQGPLLQRTELPALHGAHARVELRTERPFQLIDVTPILAERVRHSGVVLGTLCVQVLHTTAALFVNENEPRLLEDLEVFLRRLVPQGPLYRHDELDKRQGPVALAERPNAHAHLQALLLPTSVQLNVVDAALELGRWQSVFLAELDGPRPRAVSLVVCGTAERGRLAPAARPRARRREDAF